MSFSDAMAPLTRSVMLSASVVMTPVGAIDDWHALLDQAMSPDPNELIPKRIELLNVAVPGVTRVAFLQNMSNPVALSQWQELNSAARSLRIEPLVLDVRKSEDVAFPGDTIGVGAQ
jgi:hypothetical protein